MVIYSLHLEQKVVTNFIFSENLENFFLIVFNQKKSTNDNFQKLKFDRF